MSALERSLAERLAWRAVVLAGQFGVGKSELAIALSLLCARSGLPVSLVDLDVITPYFRPRDVRDVLEGAGVRVVAPENEVALTDLPAVPGAVQREVAEGAAGRRTVIVDLGGTGAGALALGMFAPLLGGKKYELAMVINRCRPESATGELERAIKEIQQSARITITGLVSNTHLKEQTTAELVVDGVRWAREVAGRCGLPLLFGGCRADLVAQVQPRIGDLPLLAIEPVLTLPWSATPAEA